MTGIRSSTHELAEKCVHGFSHESPKGRERTLARCRGWYDDDDDDDDVNLWMCGLHSTIWC